MRLAGIAQTIVRTSSFRSCPVDTRTTTWSRQIGGLAIRDSKLQARVATMATSSSTADLKDAALPKLSPAEFRKFNHMADHMDMFHSHFRHTWGILHTPTTTGALPAGMTARDYVRVGEQFCYHLEMHHTIEEQHIFPVLAERMPEFRDELNAADTSKQGDALLSQHRVIHDGLVKFQAYLEAVRHGEKKFELAEVKTLLNAFGKTLWTHMDDEVRQLGAENMRKYWTAEEIQFMPM